MLAKKSAIFLPLNPTASHPRPTIVQWPPPLVSGDMFPCSQVVLPNDQTPGKISFSVARLVGCVWSDVAHQFFYVAQCDLPKKK